jgi:hypothetical protein
MRQETISIALLILIFLKTTSFFLLACLGLVHFPFRRFNDIRHFYTLGGGVQAALAQPVERTALNRVVVGSIPTGGAFFFCKLTHSTSAMLLHRASH